MLQITEPETVKTPMQASVSVIIFAQMWPMDSGEACGQCVESADGNAVNEFYFLC